MTCFSNLLILFRLSFGTLLVLRRFLRQVEPLYRNPVVGVNTDFEAISIAARAISEADSSEWRTSALPPPGRRDRRNRWPSPRRPIRSHRRSGNDEKMIAAHGDHQGFQVPEDRSVRQSFVSSTEARRRFPLYCSSFWSTVEQREGIRRRSGEPDDHLVVVQAPHLSRPCFRTVTSNVT